MRVSRLRLGLGRGKTLILFRVNLHFLRKGNLSLVDLEGRRKQHQEWSRVRVLGLLEASQEDGVDHLVGLLIRNQFHTLNVSDVARNILGTVRLCLDNAMFVVVSIGGGSAHIWARVVITVINRDISERTILEGRNSSRPNNSLRVNNNQLQ